MSEEAALMVGYWAVIAIYAFFLIGAVAGFLPRERYPESTEDCPPGHVYIDYGETPQAGCWPEGVARELGVWPWP